MPGHRPQDQLRHRHEGAGVAGRDRDVGLALLHGLDRQPQARALAAAQGLARLVAHGDGGVGVDDDARARGERRRLLELGRDARLVAEEQEAQIRMSLERERRTGDHDLGAVIPAHGVERYRPRLRHVAGRLAVIFSDRQCAMPAATPADFARTILFCNCETTGFSMSLAAHGRRLAGASGLVLELLEAGKRPRRTGRFLTWPRPPIRSGHQACAGRDRERPTGSRTEPGRPRSVRARSPRSPGTLGDLHLLLAGAGRLSNGQKATSSSSAIVSGTGSSVTTHSRVTRAVSFPVIR